MRIITILCLTLLPSLGICQTLLSSSTNSLDFGNQAQEDWILISNLKWGTISQSDLTPEQRENIKNYDTSGKSSIWDVIGEGCSWYCVGELNEVNASSFLNQQSGVTYSPSNIHDSNYETAWVEGVAGHGIGEYIELVFQTNKSNISSITIVNGYVKSENSYYSNSRVKTFKTYLNGNFIGNIQLEDFIGEQTFNIPFADKPTDDEYILKFQIADIYEGSKHTDTVVSEIYVSNSH